MWIYFPARRKAEMRGRRRWNLRHIVLSFVRASPNGVMAISSCFHQANFDRLSTERALTGPARRQTRGAISRKFSGGHSRALVLPLVTLALCLHTGQLLAQAAAATNAPAISVPTPTPRYKDFGEVTRGMERFGRPFLHPLSNQRHSLRGDQPTHLDQPFIAPMAIARGLASAGQPLNFGDEWILVFRTHRRQSAVLRRNIHYKAPDNTPLRRRCSRITPTRC